MALQPYYNQFNFLFKQEGSYVTIQDRVVWGIDGFPTKDGYHLAMSWCEYNNGDDVNTYQFIVMKDALRFLGITSQEYHIRIYAEQEWKLSIAGYPQDNVVWHNDKYWYALIPNTEEPGTTINDWKEIVDGDDSKLDGVTYKMDGYFIPVNTSEQSNFIITKTDDHKFTVQWIGDGDAAKYNLLDYKTNPIASGDVQNNTHDFEFEKDGLYIVEYLIGGISHYAEIYDFSDSEKCFLDLMRDVLCECTDCDDCPGKNYERALQFINFYQMIRDMSCVNQSVDSSILRSDYINHLGLIIAKLALMVDSCLCKTNTNGE